MRVHGSGSAPSPAGARRRQARAASGTAAAPAGRGGRVGATVRAGQVSRRPRPACVYPAGHRNFDCSGPAPAGEASEPGCEAALPAYPPGPARARAPPAAPVSVAWRRGPGTRAPPALRGGGRGCLAPCSRVGHGLQLPGRRWAQNSGGHGAELRRQAPADGRGGGPAGLAACRCAPRAQFPPVGSPRPWRPQPQLLGFGPVTLALTRAGAAERSRPR